MNTDHPNVILPPPVILILFVLAGIALEIALPTKILSVIFSWTLGWILMAISFAVVAISVWQFSRAGTNIPTRKPANKIVQSGFYKFSRNPIYFSFTVFLAGAAIAFDNLWMLLLIVPFVPLMNWGVISREERYLEQKFGEEYLMYKSQVRRWI